ncbi:MAG: hypothetical protein SAJ12_07725 [Jaaginema sp. PMC 1079.18]|nr:hypothetical protein [Jaaginema sp. PMC 1080.18]MEC4850887.1 hypothetical protein [Jaaginema sp. PMC 1079.18]MEC4867582.1 hypothetical protein [Jaaginema sp. PMC 1078.18]
MTNSKLFDGKNSRWAIALSPLIVAMGIAIASPVSACSPAPDARPAPLSQRMSSASYVFTGTVTAINDDTVTVQIDQYFQGQGDNTVVVSGFNTHSCSDFITEPGQQYLFFAEPGENGTWQAVYDGAFGSTRPWNEDTQAELQQISSNPEAPTTTEGGLPERTADAVKEQAALLLGEPVASLTIAASESKTWNNGCLGLEFPDMSCTEAFISGWLVTVKSREKTLVYRTDREGRTVYLENGLAVLPNNIRNAVIKQASEQFNIPRNQIQVTQAFSHTWNGCLGIVEPDTLCNEVALQGWQVVLEANNARMVYHSHPDGSYIRFNEQASYIPERHDFPNALRNAVLREAAQILDIPRNQIQITQVISRNWDSCLGLGGPADSCLRGAIPGWEVVFATNNARLVYHTNADGSDIRLNEQISILPDDNRGNSNLPNELAQAIKYQATQLTGNSAVEIVSAQKQTWPNGCLGIQFPDRGCTMALVPGWQVTVESGSERLIFRTDNDGNTIFLENGRDILPELLQATILNTASREFDIPRNQLAITNAFSRTWDGCLGIYPTPNTPCTKIAIQGWQIVVEGENQRLVYHSDRDGSDIRFNAGASTVQTNTTGTIPIPDSEESLFSENMVFRATYSGGITGSTTDIILWEDGKLEQRQSNRSSIQWVSDNQIRDFRRLLRAHNFSQYDRLNFPPPAGAADTIAVTLYSQDGMTRFVDFSAGDLPQDLQAIIQGWQRLQDSAQTQPVSRFQRRWFWQR